MKKEIPLCRKCGHRHLNFLDCGEGVEAHRRRTDSKRRRREMQLEEKPRHGWIPFGDRFSNYQHLGKGNLVLLPKHTPEKPGNVVPFPTPFVERPDEAA